MIPFPEARARGLAACSPLGTERVGLKEAPGRVLAEALVCPFDQPRFDNSQVDGYAVRTADAGPRRVVGESAAGGPPPPEVRKGEAVRIFTGAPLPSGADAVAMQEDASLDSEGRVAFAPEPRKGENVRARGEEIAAGARFEVAGRPVTPPLVGLAASFGLSELAVYRKPRVVVVGTGSELVRPGTPLREGQVYASNPEAIAAALRLLGTTATAQIVRDEPDVLRDALRSVLDEERPDVLITIGGVSVGDHDLVRPTLANLGVEEILWRVSMKPGKPFYMGRKGEQRVFGLPGNPVSALVTFALLVRPALRAMLGVAEAEEEGEAVLGSTVERKDLRYEFLRATLRQTIATPVAVQGSHMQTGLAFADALIHVPDGVARIEAGERVAITPLRWGPY